MSDATTTTTKPPAPVAKTFQPITKVKTLQELFDHPGLRQRMEKTLPHHLNAERLLRTLINAGLKSPGLLKVHPMSMLGVAMTLAYLGLEPNTPLQQVHLIPFDVTKWNPATRKREYIRTDANLIIGYQGYIELIDRAGKVKDIDCQLIWPGDKWEEEHGTEKRFSHVPKYLPRKPEDEPEFAYMHARLMSGGEYTELMSRADIHLIRSRSQGFISAQRALEDAQKNNRKPSAAYTEAPWIKWPLPMFRKTPLRAGQKWLPKSAEIAVAIDMDEAGEEGRVRFDNIIEGEAVSEGAWEVPAEEQDPDEQAAATDTKEKPPTTKTTTSGRAAPAAGQAKQDGAKPPAKEAQSGDAPPPGRFADEEVAQTATDGPGGQQGGQGSETAREDGEASHAQDGEAQGGGFDAWLLDVNGEPIGEEAYADPLAFARALERAWQNPAGREALMEQNRDGIELAEAYPEAKAILDTLTEPKTEEGGAAEETIDLTVKVPTASGRENLPQYLKDFKAATMALTEDNYLDFLAANAPTMTRVAGSTRSLLVKVMSEAADRLSIARPAALTTILAGPQKDPAAELARDERAADMRIEELKDAKTPNEMQAWRSGAVLKAFTDRLEREGKRSILDRLNEAWEAQKVAIRSQPS